MGAPFGNLNGKSNASLIQTLKIACQQDNGARLRKGVNKLLQRFQEEGGIREAEFIRDTLDGKRSLHDMQSIDNNGLTSLSVLFVDAVQRLASERQGQLIEQESGTIESVGGDGREPER